MALRPPSPRVARSLRLSLAAALVAGAWVSREVASLRGAGGSDAELVVAALAGAGLEAPAGGVTWLDPPPQASLFGGERRAIVRARRGDEPYDLYLARVRAAREGRPLALTSLHPLTASPGVDETDATCDGEVAAYTTTVLGVTTAVHVLDFRGAVDPPDLTRGERVRAALTHLQESGQARGIAHHSYVLAPAAEHVALAFRDRSLRILADGREALVPLGSFEPSSGREHLEASLEERARPPAWVPWAVDRVRGISWFGDERMQYVKAIAYTALDWAQATRSWVAGPSAPPDARDELGLGGQGSAHAGSADAPGSRWPPAALTPIVTPPEREEGAWIRLDDDPFITRRGTRPAPFVTTYLRADRERASSRVFVTLWDPARVALHPEAGTIEPVSATGQAGPGVVPRAPEVLESLVAGFNGGFQAVHGDYGMQANGKVYLPPKPYAATVLELDDGSTAFGSWPPALVAVPTNVVGLRQNMTALVERGTFNPWGRTWWGGTPPGVADRIHATRSGLCLTVEGFAGYFFGSDLSAEALGRAMIAARCSYGLHLDMNAGHAGFELYHVAVGRELPPLGRPLAREWEAEGQLRDFPEVRYRARRMVRAMGHMNFPRYIHRDGRDFFYLTLRDTLPGAELVVDGARVAFDPAPELTPLERGTVSLRGRRFRVVRFDPRRVAIEGAGTGRVVATVATGGAPSAAAFEATESLVLRDGQLIVTPTRAGEAAIASGVGPRSAWARAARAAVGVEDRTGMALWVEPESDDLGPDVRDALGQVLDAASCHARLLIPRPARLVQAGQEIAAALPARIALRERPGPAARLVFQSAPIVPLAVWHPAMLRRAPLAAPRLGERAE